MKSQPVMTDDLAKLISSINEENEKRIYFNPPVMFLQLKLVTEIELGPDGSPETVVSSGPSFLYRNDQETEALLTQRQPDFLIQ